jgi:hypothetical protein
MKYTSTITQLVSPAGPIQFTNLDTTDFTAWRLTCHDLTPNPSAVQMAIQVGEGAGPTWETGNNYVYNESESPSGTLSTNTNGSVGSVLVGFGSWDSTNGASGSFVATFGNLSLSTGHKVFSYVGAYSKSAVGQTPIWGMGEWIGDTNPITAIRVIAVGGGNFYGVCTLEGLQ